MELREVIASRRSVRKFTEAPVGEEDLLYLLEMARMAPSWKNCQCWRFIVVRDEEVRERVVETLPMVNSWAKRAPVMVVVCALPDRSGYHNEMGYFLVDTAIATEHLVLAAADRGLGTCWIGLFDEDRLKEVLGIPEAVRVIALVPIGHPANGTTLGASLTKAVMRGDKRKPLEEIVRWGAW